MAQIQYRLIGQCQNALYRIIKPTAITSRKITTSRTNIGSKERITHKDDESCAVRYLIRHVRRGMPCHVHGGNAKTAKCKSRAVIGQMVKLRRIGNKVIIKVIDVLKNMLNRGNVFADDRLPAKFALLDNGRT